MTLPRRIAVWEPGRGYVWFRVSPISGLMLSIQPEEKPIDVETHSFATWKECYERAVATAKEDARLLLAPIVKAQLAHLKGAKP